MEKKSAKNNLSRLEKRLDSSIPAMFRGEKDIDDDIQMSEFALQKNVRLGLADLGLLTTVGLQTMHVYDKLCLVVLSTDNGEIRDSNKIMLMRMIHDFDSYSESFQTAISRAYSNETAVIQALQFYHPIIHVQLNQLINYLDPRPEYIRVIIIELSIKSSIPIARTVSLDTQRSLISARRCEDLDGYSQQVD
ncbi:unnamed protein product [Rotaria magnacalcarata]|uniref:Uncharacterized protein n=3 Tax=Rotaria magnacalcarata TaxID=392030 RepID=A0A820GS08_9BILA|nr:unnamed protein product [Rotaria magnacalcarata]